METFKRKKHFTMPDKPSEGIRLALSDLELCEKHPKYEINMYVWHSPKDFDDDESICEVCLGGAILARKEDNPKYIISPTSDELEGDGKILSMESFRRGFVSTGVMRYCFSDGPFPLSEKIDKIEEFAKIDEYYRKRWVDYKLSPKRFKKNLFDIADKLEALGL